MSTASSAADAREGVDATIAKLHKRVRRYNGSIKDHLRIARTVRSVRNLIAKEPIARKSLVRLLCSGVAMFSSGCEVCKHGMDDDTARLAEETEQTCLDSSLCVFVLLAQANGTDAAAEHEQTVRTYDQETLWNLVQDPPCETDQETATVEQRECQERQRVSWAAVVRTSERSLAGSTLSYASTLLSSDSVSTLRSLAYSFYRHSRNSMKFDLLMPDGDVDFVTLHSQSLAKVQPEEREARLLSIAQAAESEAGQSVVRDLMLSMTLPHALVATRRTLIMPRVTQVKAGIDHPSETQRAHEVAMQGSEWTYVNASDDLERMCSLLAGIALLTTHGAGDPIRKADAFDGRVMLPFLEVKPSTDTAKLRIILIPEVRRWVVFRLTKDGKPKVVSSRRGYEGLCDAALQMLDDL